MSPVIIFLIALVVLGLFVLSWYQSSKRRKALSKWAETRGFSFEADSDRAFDEKYPSFNCLQQGSDRYAYNILEGRWGEYPAWGFDYHYETSSTDSKGHRTTHNHYFSAVILQSKFLLNPLFIRPEGFLDKITEFFGFDDIDFESAEFSRKFFVKAQDKRWAYDVIHQRTMEFLLSMPQFTLQFAHQHVMAYRISTFSMQEFESAMTTAQGVLDRIPDYVAQKQREGA